MLHVQMYHTKPFAGRELSIKGDPYKHDLVKQLLISLGVIFYRDENHGHSPLDVPDIEPSSSAYYSQVVFNENTWTIDKWAPKQMQKSDKKFIDSFVWLQENVPVTIHQMLKSTVKRSL